MSLFVTLEGTEGCGKSTQAAKLASYLADVAKRDVVLTREPGGTDTTREIRRLLADPQSNLDRNAELLLFLADRAQHVTRVIKPGLARGAVVICDRYADSTVAYQGYGRGHDLEILGRLNGFASYDVAPDLTVWLDCDIESALHRATKTTGSPGDRFEAEPLEFHRRVRQGFVDQAKRYPERITRVEGDAAIEVVFASVLALVEARLR